MRLFILFFLLGLSPTPTLINGRPAQSGEYPEVVYIQTGNSSCTATIVGPRVIITAAHCAQTGSTSTFQLDKRVYKAKMTRSPLYPRNDHDIALGIIDQEVTGIKFASIGGDASKGVDITLAGYGCVRPGGGGGNDGILRVGDNRVINLSGYDMVSRMQGGGALCFGDSGGPAFLRDTNILLGVNSKGNIQDTNYNTRTDTQASRDFFAKFAQQTGVEICGINKDCGDESKPAPEPQGDCATNAHAVNNAKRLLAVRVDEMMSCMGLAAFN